MNLADALQATWPPARSFDIGPFTLRGGEGGGKRVSAASVHAPFTGADLDAAEGAMRAIGQSPLFAIWPEGGDFGLDAALAQRGYDIVDPVVGYGADAQDILRRDTEISHTYPHWPPLAITREVWAEAGIGPARLDVMARAAGPKTAILVRHGDHPAGVCFVAIASDHAMIHALEVLSDYRRMGLAQRLITRAALWATSFGAAHLSLVVTRVNAPARALYARMGMAEIGQYHYRQLHNHAADALLQNRHV
jgi:GNAT superfamily N-acetyltransferase